MSQAHHVEHARRSTFPARSKDPAADEDRQIAMLKPSNGDV